MHGRPRTSLKAQQESESNIQQRDAIQKKTALYIRLQNEVLRNHVEKKYTTETLQLNAKILELNPDFSTAWNFRKSAIRHFLSQETTIESRKALFQEELFVTERALKKNYKAYGPWYHRKWIVSFGESELKREFELLDKFLKADSRNFHGWDYRRFILEKAKTSFSHALEFTTQKINENFSNYSAWHARSHLLPKIEYANSTMNSIVNNSSKNDSSEKSFTIPLSVLKDEFELVRQAFFTEPDDQSGWMYYTWLLKKTFPSLSPSPSLSFSFPLPNSSFSINSFTDDFFSIVLTFNTPVNGVNDDSICVSLEEEEERREGEGMERGGKGREKDEDVDKGKEKKKEKDSSSSSSFLNFHSSSWKALTAIDSYARVWVKEIKLESYKSSNLDHSFFKVKVKVNSKESIRSSSGSILIQPFDYQFHLINDIHSPKIDHSLSSLHSNNDNEISINYQECKQVKNDDDNNNYNTNNSMNFCFDWPGCQRTEEAKFENENKNNEFNSLDRVKVMDMIRYECGVKDIKEVFKVCDGDGDGDGDDDESEEKRKSREELKKVRMNILNSEIQMCRELLELEPDSKWTLLTLSRLLECQTAVKQNSKSKSNPKSSVNQMYEEMNQIYERLMHIDKYRTNYYSSLIGKLNLKKVLGNKDVLFSKFCLFHSQFKKSNELTQSCNEKKEELWWRMNSMNISHIDFEFKNNLLWLKKVDLSDNKLRSACGLESLQSLVSLDLSKNQISHTDALKPLSFLLKLKALNLANNWIGLQRVFTQRYITHTGQSQSQSQSPLDSIRVRFAKIELSDANASLKGTSDLLQGLRSLSIVALEMNGNEVEEWEGYVWVLREILPGLQFLNGNRFGSLS